MGHTSCRERNPWPFPRESGLGSEPSLPVLPKPRPRAAASRQAPGSHRPESARLRASTAAVCPKPLLMQTLFRSLSGLALAALAAAASAQITFLRRPRFGGRQFTANQAVANFSDIGFNDRAASAIIRGGIVAAMHRRLLSRPLREPGARQLSGSGDRRHRLRDPSARELTSRPGPGGGGVSRAAARWSSTRVSTSAAARSTWAERS